MKQLSGLDASFLYLEKPEMPMHVGALHLFELPASYRGSFVADMRRHMASRLVLAPALRRKLAWMPFNLANPVWADAPPDLDQHIVAIKLPKDSAMSALERQVGELHPALLDRTRPLWQFFVFEGLAPGPGGEKRYGLYSKLREAVFPQAPKPRYSGQAVWRAVLPRPPEITQTSCAIPRRKIEAPMVMMINVTTLARGARAIANFSSNRPTMAAITTAPTIATAIGMPMATSDTALMPPICDFTS